MTNNISNPYITTKLPVCFEWVTCVSNNLISVNGCTKFPYERHCRSISLVLFTLRVDDKHYEDIFAYGKDGG